MKISKDNIAGLLTDLSKEFCIFVPSKDDGTVAMTLWDGRDTDFLDWYRNTITPPKAVFLPPFEEMFSFHKEKQRYKVQLPAKENKRRLIFGVRPCDANALTILDRVFQSDYQDSYYMSKRKNTIIIGIGCTRPYDSCFCTSLNSNPTDSTNVDIMLTDIGENYLIEPVTEAGKELLVKSDKLVAANTNDDKVAEKVKREAIDKIARRLDTADIDKQLLKTFESETMWQDIAAKCVSCGICTLLCPTCYCFDINDELIKNMGARYRSWDSCSFATYTKMPAENPRIEKWRRVRNKTCHKYEFYPMNYGVIACTGCGRCIRQCPVNWDIVQTLQSIQAEADSVSSKGK
jgi:ferredoxin